MYSIDVYAIAGFREPVSCFTHLLAAPVFAVLGYFLLREGRGNWGRIASLGAMAFSTVFLLLMSSAYHSQAPGAARHIMRQLDLAAIFVLIAGTATPVHVILFQGFRRWAPLLLIWLATATGIPLRIIFSDTLDSLIGTAIFVVLGWGGLISCVLLWRRYGFSFVKPLLLGGIAYTLGAIIADLRWPTLIPGAFGAHELWHVAVLVGLGLHWQFVFRFASGPPESAGANGWIRSRRRTTKTNARHTATVTLVQ